MLDRITAAYLQRNLRPEVQSITVHPPGEVFQKPISVTGEPEILGLDTPTVTAPGAPKAPPRRPPDILQPQAVPAGPPDLLLEGRGPERRHPLLRRLLQAVGESRFRPLRKGLTEPVLAWDTSTVPNGRYVVRVVASDAPANPAALALTGEKESTSFEVDNTPPDDHGVPRQTARPLRIRATSRDDASPVRKAEFSIDGGRWEEVHPVDGINDSLEETYEFTPEGLTPGPHVVVIRAIDLLGNAATARVETPDPDAR